MVDDAANLGAHFDAASFDLANGRACRFKTCQLIPRVLRAVWRVLRGGGADGRFGFPSVHWTCPFSEWAKGLVFGREALALRGTSNFERGPVRYRREPLGVPLLHDGASRRTRGLVPMVGSAEAGFVLPRSLEEPSPSDEALERHPGS